jgi:hypothetical protein
VFDAQRLFALALRRDQEGDRLTDDLDRAIAELCFGGRVPTRDDTVQRLRPNCVIRRFDHSAQVLPHVIGARTRRQLP